jgi:hypothetical protein
VIFVFFVANPSPSSLRLCVIAVEPFSLNPVKEAGKVAAHENHQG